MAGAGSFGTAIDSVLTAADLTDESASDAARRGRRGESPSMPRNEEDTRSADAPMRRLFQVHYAAIWRLLRRLGVQSAGLDDAAQEVFWVAARKLTEIRPGREHAFLYGVAIRVASHEHHRRKTAPATAAMEELARLHDCRPSPEEHLAQRQARALLDVVLDQMPIELRTVFVLCELEELEVRAAAALEGIPVGTASSRLRRAREAFSAIAKRVRTALTARGGAR
jgi:RNA polymerase sigma-70 factor, ECF subfamily